MGRYTVRATRHGVPLKILMRFSTEYVSTATADFEPAYNGATIEVTSPPLVVQWLVFGAIGLVERTLGRGLRSGARTVLRTATVDAQGHATRTVAAKSLAATPH